MTIGRIKEIKNIGTFANFSNGASLGFEKLTFIYGFNTFGKTTLTDIFQSLKHSDAQIIQSRKTIPQQNSQQKVLFTEKNTTESDVKFENNIWSNNSISNNLEIFGTDFIHKNIFTGLAIERSNKENFTQFVLGEQGVNLAREIAEKKKALGDKKRDLKSKVPHFVKNSTNEEIKKFLEFPVDVSEKEEIGAQFLQKQTDLQKQKDLLENPTKILNLQEPNVFSEPVLNIIELLNDINSLLQENYSSVKDDLLVRLKQHIDSNFSATDNAEGWVKTGTQYCKNGEDGNCPFCGQSLKGASDLMDIYNSYFDGAYNNFISRIEDDLSSKLMAIERVNFRYKSQLQDALTMVKEFKSLITSPDFLTKISDLESKISFLQEDELNQKKETILFEIKSQCDLKNKAPHKKVNIVDTQDFLVSLNAYVQLLREVKIVINGIRADIIQFKELYKNIQEIQKKISGITQEVNDLEYKKVRIDLDLECKTYANLQSEIVQLEMNIALLQERLRTDQSNYLDIYFTEINKLFKKLGSKDFTLDKDIDNTGHMPVCSLKVEFHGVGIPNNQLKTVFSESDRRTLSLAIFWARICLKTNDEKAKTVIILDDPATSFDDNRVTNSVNLFKEILGNISQMVILTHYPHFIKRFCEITKEAHLTVKYLKIDQNTTTSLLIESNREEFTQSDYDKTFLKIYGFINQTHSESIKTDLRPFFENLYLPIVFAKQIRDKQVDCSSLKTMIDGIFDDSRVKTKLQKFRTTLNPDSHFFTSNNDEDVRNFASEMMDYLYSISLVG